MMCLTFCIHLDKLAMKIGTLHVRERSRKALINQAKPAYLEAFSITTVTVVSTTRVPTKATPP